MSKWVRPSDQLPAEEKEVLIWSRAYNSPSYGPVMKLASLRHGRFWHSGGVDGIENVFAWRELPEPPNA